MIAVAAIALALAGPPPAYATAATKTYRLAEGSYCWATQCVDKVPDLVKASAPRIVVRLRSLMRFRLGFTPSSARLVVAGRVVQTVGSGARITWRVNRGGYATLEVRGPRGSVGYVARIVVR